MNINPEELLGEDDEDLSARHAVKSGAHDAIATLVQYGVIAGIVVIGGYALLDKRTRERLKQRWL